MKLLYYKAFLSMTGDGLIEKDKKERNGKTDFLAK